MEVDLSIVLDDIKQPAPAPAARAGAAPAPSAGSRRRVRQHARPGAASGLDDAEKEYKRGLALRKAGDIDGCIQALEKASRAPKLRFATSWLIARLYRDRGMMPAGARVARARVAGAARPNAEDGHQVLYELADALEQSGEVARALAICMELESDAAGYRDVAERIDRLTKVQAEG